MDIPPPSASGLLRPFDTHPPAHPDTISPTHLGLHLLNGLGGVEKLVVVFVDHGLHLRVQLANLHRGSESKAAPERVTDTSPRTDMWQDCIQSACRPCLCLELCLLLNELLRRHGAEQGPEVSVSVKVNPIDVQRVRRRPAYARRRLLGGLRL